MPGSMPTRQRSSRHMGKQGGGWRQSPFFIGRGLCRVCPRLSLNKVKGLIPAPAVLAGACPCSTRGGCPLALDTHVSNIADKMDELQYE